MYVLRLKRLIYDKNNEWKVNVDNPANDLVLYRIKYHHTESYFVEKGNGYFNEFLVLLFADVCVEEVWRLHHASDDSRPLRK